MAMALDEWMTASQAATALGLSRPRIHQLVRSQQLEGRRVAGRLFIRRSAVQALQRKRRGAGGQQAARPATMRELRRQRDRIRTLADRHGAHDIRVFGSVARGEARHDSDIDFVVTMDRGRTVIDLAELIVDLEEALGRRVDVVEVKRPSRTGSRILAEAIAL